MLIMEYMYTSNSSFAVFDIFKPTVLSSSSSFDDIQDFTPYKFGIPHSKSAIYAALPSPLSINDLPGWPKEMLSNISPLSALEISPPPSESESPPPTFFLL